MDFYCLILISIFLAVVSHWYITKQYHNLQKKNIPLVPDPIFGLRHILSIITLKEGLITLINKFYNNSSASVIGFYFFKRSAIIIRDPKLMESVLETNFSSFSSNYALLSEKADPVFTKNPFFINDIHEWKISRIRAINHFTGKKLNWIFIIIQHVCLKMNDFLIKKINDGEGSFECELKEFANKYTGEFVANAVYAVEGQSFEEHPDPLSFTNVAQLVFEPTVINNLKQALIFYMPKLANLLGIKFLPKKADKFFRHNAIKSVKLRKQSKREVKDYLQFCMELNSENDIDGIVSDLAVIYLDSYETTGSALSAVLYYLSQNEEVQEKARVHIASVLKVFNGILTYESLKNMDYIDQILFEALRLIPPLGVLGKICTEDITLKGSDGLKCHFQPGDQVFIPLWAIHHDPQYWSAPEVFDPSRFNLENQTDRNKFIFLPFNKGPRMCPGRRLGSMLIKLAVISILKKYSLGHSTKTELPFKLEPTALFTVIKGGLWAKFNKLENKFITA